MESTLGHGAAEPLGRWIDIFLLMHIIELQTLKQTWYTEYTQMKNNHTSTWHVIMWIYHYYQLQSFKQGQLCPKIYPYISRTFLEHDTGTFYLSKGLLVRRFTCLKHISIGLGFGLGSGLASNFGICTTPFWTNDPLDKWPLTRYSNCPSLYQQWLTWVTVEASKLTVHHYNWTTSTNNWTTAAA